MMSRAVRLLFALALAVGIAVAAGSGAFASGPQRGDGAPALALAADAAVPVANRERCPLGGCPAAEEASDPCVAPASGCGQPAVAGTARDVAGRETARLGPFGHDATRPDGIDARLDSPPPRG